MKQIYIEPAEKSSFKMMWYYYDTRNIDKAVKFGEKYLKEDYSNSKEFLLTLAIMYMKLKRYDDAEALCKKAIKRFPDYELLHSYLGYVYSNIICFCSIRIVSRRFHLSR